MSDVESILSPVTPDPRSIADLRNSYIERAKRNSSLGSSLGSAPYTASSKTFGTEWGVGVGLHFELIKWLRWLSLLLMLCAVPFLVVVGSSVFTDAAHMYDHSFGVKKYPVTKVHSLTLAAVVDDSVDNGTLQYMNTMIVNTWNGPMRKSTFLIWISLVDAGSMLLFLVGLAVVWYHLKTFAKTTDKDTLEAADYTVLVRGLPTDTDAAQVGEHFSRYGEVMDVVLVTDRLSATLRHCGRAAQLQQRRAMVLDASKVRETDERLGRAVLSGKYAVMMDKLDQDLADIAEEIRGVAELMQSVKAAFVTFNSENERRACEAQCPNSWLGSLMQRRHDRFHGKHRFWVRHAAAPEDYKFEDLAVSEWQLFAREVAINVAMLLLVLLCAAAIAKLTDISNQESATLKWYGDRLVADSAASMVLYANNGSVLTIPEATAAGDFFSGELYPQLEAFCSRQLSDTCTSRLQSEYGGLVRAVYAQGLKWVNATSRLLFERAVQSELVCSIKTSKRSAACQLQGCLPCLCLGISLAGPTSSVTVAPNPSDSDNEAVCSPYINLLDVRTWGVRLSISAVVAVLNAAIKWVLSVLVLHGRHWTHTARERSFALQCFVAMLFNTVVVLLVTNCEALGRLARESQNGNWTRFFVRYGAYSDFTAGWYENVGLSILILMIINTGSPLLNLLLEELLLVGRRCCVLYCIVWPLQSDYDMAWARPRFTLAQRTADLLLNASLALLFGSGMPLCYLVFAVYLLVAELADRWALTRLCGGAPRYNTGLTELVMDLLPWQAAAHCAFGLWMHTYFSVVVPVDSSGIEEVSQLSVAVNNARLTSTSSDLAVIQHSTVWQRITQPNGLALLLLFVALALWLLIGRFVIWNVLSCLGRVAGRLLCCVSHGSRMMRGQIYKDTQLQVDAVPYAEALLTRQLHGTPTYRLAHHPHYLQYFAASGLNRAMGVAALVMSAANGGARRRSVYTRLTTVQRRGRLPAGSSAFRVLPSPVVDKKGLQGSESVFGPLPGQGRRSAANPEESHLSSMADLDVAVGQQQGFFLYPLPPMPRPSSRYPKPIAGPLDAEMMRAPDVVELLQEEQMRTSIPALLLGPGRAPPPQLQLPADMSPRAVAAMTATAAAIVNIVPAAATGGGGGGGGDGRPTSTAEIEVVADNAAIGDADVDFVDANEAATGVVEAIAVTVRSPVRAHSQLEAGSPMETSPLVRQDGARRRPETTNTPPQQQRGLEQDPDGSPQQLAGQQQRNNPGAVSNQVANSSRDAAPVDEALAVSREEGAVRTSAPVATAGDVHSSGSPTRPTAATGDGGGSGQVPSAATVAAAASTGVRVVEDDPAGLADQIGADGSPSRGAPRT